MAAGGLLLLGGGLLASDRLLAVSSAATLAAQATYVLGGLASAGGAGLILDGIVHVPAFAAGRLRMLGRVATGRGARTWVRTTRAAASGDGDDAVRWGARREPARAEGSG